ncbi:hypothetical protein [Jannaschia seohaensis]|uniref:Uncharacterized protein n=1 Tax=Jannaschia seohaensis TaxID=475081 RepID=A0A2Y9C0T1_9RHOB|nr:hypothetical protein [Jannaschia seohaensis]PWJ18287.1 hypothetical protein BCF38_105275 [Jannaschia seohaensis]SSA46812.1 hypothetical protein SAMN05421539_105275 [Jannaschia seohaensis]
MFMRLAVIVVSLSLLGGSGYASWYGWGAVDRDTGPGSMRTGSTGGGFGFVRVK